jgi:predicted solute-binding protein
MNRKDEILKVGMIPYWNLLPCSEELNRAEHRLKMEIQYAAPRAISQLLQTGGVHVAPCSSICLSKPGFEMAFPCGVFSDGPVMSVYLGFNESQIPLYEFMVRKLEALQSIFAESRHRFDHNARLATQYILDEVSRIPGISLADSPSIHFSQASLASVALTKIFYTLCFGKQSYALMSARHFEPLHNTQRPISLLIGNEAMIQRSSFSRVLDLGKAWKDLTSYPFVFAVWQSYGLCLNGWRRKLFEVCELAERKMVLEPARYYPTPLPVGRDGQAIPLAEYWKKIRYKMGPQEIKGLLLYLCLAKRCADEELDREIAVKISRWEEFSHENLAFPTL